jgi:predicted Zn-dependent peptidase
MDITQGNLVMGFRTGVTAADPDYPAMVMFNTVFGGGITSKLFTHVRERLSLCYYASSGMEKFKGIMVVSSGVDMDKYQMARDEILRQLDLCRAGKITQEELESARSALLSGLRSSEDSLSHMVDYALSQEIGKYDYAPQDLADALAHVTVADVQRAAEKVKLDTIFFLKGAV